MARNGLDNTVMCNLTNLKFAHCLNTIVTVQPNYCSLTITSYSNKTSSLYVRRRSLWWNQAQYVQFVVFNIRRIITLVPHYIYICIYRDRHIRDTRATHVHFQSNPYCMCHQQRSEFHIYIYIYIYTYIHIYIYNVWNVFALCVCLLHVTYTCAIGHKTRN